MILREKIMTAVFALVVLVPGLSLCQWPWPADNTPEVCGSFGTFEAGGDGFHDAVDIFGVPGTTKTVAVAAGRIVAVNRQNNSINIYVELGAVGSNQFAVYVHCEELGAADPDFVNLYDGTYAAGFNPLPAGPIALAANQKFATIATVANAGTTFPHVHFAYQDGATFHVDRVNPLEQTTEHDPDTNDPMIGPVYFRVQGGGYLTLAADEALKEKVDIIVQLTDDMGHLEPNASPIADADIWEPPPAGRWGGITSSPYVVSVSILNPPESKGYVWHFPELTFTGHPIGLGVLMEAGKHSQMGPEYRYCYNLTNITVGGNLQAATIDPDGCWNTKLKQDEDMDGIDATRNGEAQFPDDMYGVEPWAEDQRPLSNVWDEQPVHVNNFSQTVESERGGGKAAGNLRVASDTFVEGETLFITGQEYQPNQEYNVYVFDDRNWNDGDALAGARIATTVTSDANGNIPATAIWPALPLGGFDICVDYGPSHNQLGRLPGDDNYNAPIDGVTVDGLDDNDIETAGFIVFGIDIHPNPHVCGGACETGHTTSVDLKLMNHADFPMTFDWWSVSVGDDCVTSWAPSQQEGVVVPANQELSIPITLRYDHPPGDPCNGIGSMLEFSATVQGADVVDTEVLVVLCEGGPTGEIYLSASENEKIRSIDGIAPFELFNFYVVVDVDPWIAGWEASVNYDPAPFLMVARDLRHESLNIGEDDNFLVGFPDCPFTPLVVVTYTAMLLGPFTDCLISLGPAEPSSFPGDPEPAWADCHAYLRPFEESWSTNTLIINPTLAGMEETPTIPNAYALHSCVPNPFNPKTTIRYDMPEPGRVSLRVFDISGRLVKTIINGDIVAASRHEADWNGQDESGRTVAAGVYFYRLETAGFTKTKSMTLLK